MISIDMKWYHQLWFVPLAVIMLLIQLPFALAMAPFRKK